MKDKKKDGILSGKEIISYGLSSPAVNLGALMAISFLSSYWTDVAGLSAAAIAMIFLVARIFDGFTDIVMGVIVDKTHTKWGKAKPWVLIGGVCSAFAATFLFSVPQSMSAGGKVAYAAVTYFLFSAIFNTMTGISTSTMTAYVSDSATDRTAMGASFMTIQTLADKALQIVTLPMIVILGSGQRGWTTWLIILGLLSFVFLFIFLRNVKERFSESKEDAPKLNIRSALGALFHNPYFFLVTGIGMSINIENSLVNSVGVYYSRLILGNKAFFSLMSLAALIPALFGIPLSVPLVNKIGKVRSTILGLVVCVIGCAMMYIAPSNVALICVGIFIRELGRSPMLACYNAFVAEASDYSQYKSGLQMQGISFSGTSFGNKVGAGIGGWLLGAILSVSGYQGTAAVQTAAALGAIKGMYIIGAIAPAIAVILLVLPMKKLEEMHPQIHEALYTEKEVEEL